MRLGFLSFEALGTQALIEICQHNVVRTVRRLQDSSRTAREYGLSSNAAEEGEAPRALDVACGTPADAEILKAIGTGMYLSNVHYLNWADIDVACDTYYTRALGGSRVPGALVEGWMFTLQIGSANSTVPRLQAQSVASRWCRSRGPFTVHSSGQQ